MDRAILGMLQDDARRSLVSLAGALHLSTSAVHERVRRLQEGGYVQSVRARLDYAALGLGVSAYIGLQTPQSAPVRERLLKHARLLPEVDDLVWVTGDFDALLHVRVHDTAHLEDVLFRILDGLGDTVRARTMVVLSEPLSKAGPDRSAWRT